MLSSYSLCLACARALFALLLCASVVVPSPTLAAADESDPEVSERVEVTATRLRQQPADVEQLPAHVTVIDRQAIEAAGVRTLQDLLLFEAGAMVHDQVGNAIETTFDLRGLNGGAGTRVFLDGAPLNDPRNNSLALDLLPLRSLERVEITRGSVAALGGSGAEGGVIHLVSREGSEEITGSLSLATGTFDTTDLGGDLAGSLGPVRFRLSGSDHDTDGFRQNSGGDVTRLAAGFAWDPAEGHTLQLNLFDTDSALGNPGALTETEISADPEPSPFNSLDYSESRHGQAALNYNGTLGAGIALGVNLFARDRENTSLTTGRSAPAFGGFQLATDESTFGATLQATHVGDANLLTAGLEWLDGETDALGIATPAADPGLVDPANISSNNVIDRRTQAIFAQDSWQPTERLHLLAGARYDRDRIGYSESIPDPTLRASRTFSELSLRAGAVFQVNDRHGLYVSYSEAFQPPTVEDLFAFPTFGSNPDLDAEDSETYELGWRSRLAGATRMQTAVFITEKTNEIVFDPDSPLGLFGASVNGGETRREGLELSFNGRPVRRVSWFANLTLIDAEFRNGDNQGKEIPLVPGEQLALGVELQLPAGLRMRADTLLVSEQVLDNDGANAQQEIDSYTVVNVRFQWDVPGASGLSLFVESRNLLDEEYATRGIYAFDFSDGFNKVFLTPAPERRYLGGAEWVF